MIDDADVRTALAEYPDRLSTGLEQASFAIESLTRRQPYPQAEVATQRAYFLARAR